MIKYYALPESIEVQGIEINQVAVHTALAQNVVVGNGILLAKGLRYDKRDIAMHSLHKGLDFRLGRDTLCLNGTLLTKVELESPPAQKLDLNGLLNIARCYYLLLRAGDTHGKECVEKWLSVVEDLYEIETLPDGSYVASSPTCATCKDVAFSVHPITGV